MSVETLFGAMAGKAGNDNLLSAVGGRKKSEWINDKIHTEF